MIKAIIVDDEEDARISLSVLISTFCPDVQIVAEANSAIEGLKKLKVEKPDVVFLDVEMPGGTGFDLLEEMGHLKIPVIFTTAHKEYAIRAIKAAAFDYLLKPVDPDELCRAVRLLKENIADTGKVFFRPDIHNKIRFTDSKGVTLVNQDEIVYLKAEGRYTLIVLNTGIQHMVTRNLGEFESELNADNFFRVHKSFIVHMDQIKMITNKEGGFIELKNGLSIEIARRRKGELMEKIRNR